MLSFAEILWSMRVVKKFSVAVSCLMKLYWAMSPEACGVLVRDGKQADVFEHGGVGHRGASRVREDAD